jgi:hypothetical protein
MKLEKQRLAAAIAALVCLQPIFSAGAQYSAVGSMPAAVPGLMLPAATPSLNTNPALMSGVPSLTVPTFGIPGAQLPSAAINAVIPALPGATLPLAKIGAAAQAEGAKAPQTTGAQAVLNAVGGAIDASSNKEQGAPESGSVLNQAFDGVKLNASSVDGSGPANGGGNGGGGSNNNDGGSDAKGPNDGNLGRLFPRVVMILDTLNGPASEKLVKQVEKLADAGVRVVFVTPRADKGDDSADSILISKLKRRTGNPIVVVSYNGAHITAHNSKAEHPKPLVEDLEGLSPNAVGAFQKIGRALATKLGGQSEPKEFGVPSMDSAHIYGAELPAGVDLSKFVSSFNEMLRNRGMKYKVEGVAGPDGRNYFFTQSTALKLNTSRLFNALYAQNPDLRGSLQREQVLILADSTKAANFLKSVAQTEDVPGKGFYIHGIKDAASTEHALDALLGNAALDKVSVMRSKLRSYSEWLDARAKWGGAPRRDGNGSGGFNAASPAKGGRFYRDLGFYRGIIMYDLMGRLYHLLRKGQYMEASPEAAIDLLDRMWRNPRANGVRISDEMDASLRILRKTDWGRKMAYGYFDTSRTWLRNYYKRNLPNFPAGVSEKVVGTMINLARDSKNSVTLEYASPYTGRRYMVHALPARAHLERDDKGNLLVAHVYRTGKEPYESEFEDSVETNLMAATMLAGYADKREDGKWYVNDEPNPRVKVVFHYMTRDLSRILTPEELDAQGAEVTTLIEKMQSDTEFLAHWDEQEAKNNKVAEGVAKAKAAAEKRAASGKKKAVKPAKKG